MVFAARYGRGLLECRQCGEDPRIRRYTPADHGLQKEFFNRLSSASLYQRFMQAMVEIPPVLLQRMSDVDQKTHVLLLAEAGTTGHRRMVGEARFVIDRCDAARCEFAISVADEWQGRGLGRRMLACLEREARTIGIRHIHGEILAGNNKMHALARNAGYRVRMNRNDARIVDIEKDLAMPTVRRQGTSAGLVAA